MADYSTIKALANDLGCLCRENEPMSKHTTFQIGGNADLFFEPTSVEVLSEIVCACRQQDIPVTVIGNGSNLLVSDFGIEGAVIHIGGGFSDITTVGAYEIECGAGVKLARLCSSALDNSLTGLEFAWGIPGSAGGAAYMNAGAYGSEMKSVLLSCSHITTDGKIGERVGDELDLSYRHSAYCDSGDIIVSMRLRLNPGEKDSIRTTMDDLMGRRKDKQPLEYPSAGSIFKRPPGYFAGGLIEECGLKGYTIGGAQVSEKHAGFIINTGGASCSDVRRLIEHIQNEVFLRTSIRLETEVKMIGKL